MKLIHLCFFALSLSLMAQTATLRGVVSDETGASVPSARVTVNGPNGARSVAAAADGSYALTGLPAGDYTVEASAPSLVLQQPVKVALDTGIRMLNLQLRVVVTTQQITVEESAAPLSTEASNNVSAMILRGKDLDALSDDPEDLQADLQALAGPAAGPNGGDIFVDGFSGGQLPAKESIREIRINQNPFAPEYDRIGLGRVEVLTKPGTDKLRGTVSYNHMGEFWNSRNPYAAQKATLQLNEFRSNLSGPLNHRASFTLDVTRDSVDNGSIVNAITLDPQTLAVTPYTAIPVTPQRRTEVSPRIDYQLNSANTLTVRYTYSRSDIRDAGIGNFDLRSRGYETPARNQQVQLTETSVHGATVNETRFQYSRQNTETIPNFQDPSIFVLGSFYGGGAQTGHAFNFHRHYEFQNYTTVIRGGHTVKFGMRTRLISNDSISPQNYNGTFTFAGGQGPALDSNNQPILDASGQPVLIAIDSIERYRRTLLFERLGYTAAQIRATGGGATQFSMSAGNPEIAGNQVDVGTFLGDDWKVRPNFTVSAGVRYEAQTNIQDQWNWAPRIGVAWAPGGTAKKQPKTVIRAGFGIFYDRFSLNNTLTARRYNGLVQQQYVVTNPDFFPDIPAVSTLAGMQSKQIIQEVDSNLRSPYVMQSSLTIERQLPAGSTMAVTYTNSRGLHSLRSLDINAPLPGTYDVNAPGSGIFPFGNPNPLFLMTSSGVYNQNQLALNVNAKVNRTFSLTGSYTWNHAQSNTDGLGTYPSNPYNYAGEYGPAATDIHHTVSASGTIDTRWNIRLSPLINIQSGAPFNITTGGDPYGTTLFNARPGIATDASKAGLIPTQYGLLDPSPVPGEPILSRNYGRGPGQVSVNLRIAKTVAFGPEQRGASGSAAMRRYNLSLSLSVRNLLNHTNPGPIIGNITSPLFGRANQMAGGPGGGGFSENANNRRLELQSRFTF
jgi:carboxypeptidase family protein